MMLQGSKARSIVRIMWTAASPQSGTRKCFLPPDPMLAWMARAQIPAAATRGRELFPLSEGAIVMLLLHRDRRCSEAAIRLMRG
jgi:hypothetical protein